MLQSLGELGYSQLEPIFILRRDAEGAVRYSYPRCGKHRREAKTSGQFVVPGLGNAVKDSRQARTGCNPQIGEPIQVPAKTVVKFRLAKAFKDAVVPPKKK